MAEGKSGGLFGGVEYVFLDRDGVINRKMPEGEYVTRAEEMELLPGAGEAIAALNRAGRKVLVVSNQRGVALGRMSPGDLDAVNLRMREELGKFGARLDAVYCCPHGRGQCECRKPGTGMILRAFAEFAGAGTGNSVLVGDSVSDIECGVAVGMRTLFVLGEEGTRKGGWEVAREKADGVVGSLGEAVGLLPGVVG